MGKYYLESCIPSVFYLARQNESKLLFIRAPGEKYLPKYYLSGGFTIVLVKIKFAIKVLIDQGSNLQT